jgi:putative aldouronate transport system substrate-binding protein
MTKRALLAGTVATALLVGCGQGTKDLSYANPEWRSSVNKAVSFPLAEKVTLRVGLGAGAAAPAPESASLAWIEQKTNIKLEFVTLAGGRSAVDPGMTGGMDIGQIAAVELGELVRSGKLPDVVPEASFDLGDETYRNLFVDVLEFPELTPSFRRVVAATPRFRDGLLARLSAGDKLYSLGSYDPDFAPFGGVLAYRQDVFQARGLKTDTWQSIRTSLQALKTAYPDSQPFGGMFNSILTMMPSWFGSGYDRSNVVYFDNDSAEWRFGPYESQFEDMVRYLADLYKQGLMSPELMTAREDSSTRDFSNNRVFMAPYSGLTGPFFRFVGDYGALTPEGTWNGQGAWVSSLRLPPPPSGGAAKVSARRFSPAADGWLVYNQSKHVGEALALLDFLFTDDAARVLGLGPEGTVWQQSGSRVELLEPYKTAYREGGTASVAEKKKAAGLPAAFPLKGLAFGYVGAFGYPESPTFRYFFEHEAAVNRLGVDLYAETGLRIPFYDKEFSDQRATAVVTLQSHIESQVAQFVIGQRALDQYGAFKAELAKMGADGLLKLYRERCTLGDPKVLAGK